MVMIIKKVLLVGFLVYFAFACEERLFISNTNEISIWNPRSGERMDNLGREAFDPGLTISMKFSFDGNKLATSLVDNNIDVWDVRNPRANPIKLLGGVATHFNLDGSKIFGLRNENSKHELLSWNVQNQEKPTVYSITERVSNSANFLRADGELLGHISGSDVSVININNYTTLIKISMTEPDTKALLGAFSDAQREVLAVVNSKNAIEYWNISTGAIITNNNSNSTNEVIHNPLAIEFFSCSIGEYLLVASESKFIIQNSSHSHSIPFELENVHTVVFEKSSGYAAINNQANTVVYRLEELVNGTVSYKKTLNHSSRSPSKIILAISPQGWLATLVGRAIELEDLAENSSSTKQRISEIRAGASRITINPQNKNELATISDDNAYLWDIKNKTRKRIALGKHQPNNLVFSNDGKEIIFSDKNEKGYGKKNRETKSVDFYAVEEDIFFLAARPTGRLQFAYRSSSSKIFVFNDKNQPFDVSEHKLALTSIAYNHNGTLFASGSADGAIIVWDCTDDDFDRKLALPVKHSGSITSLVFSADGNKLFSGSTDNKIMEWDLRSGEFVNTLQDHTATVNALEVSSDGKLLFSAGNDNRVRIWNLETYAVNHTLRPHPGRVSGLLYVCLSLSRLEIYAFGLLFTFLLYFL